MHSPLILLMLAQSEEEPGKLVNAELQEVSRLRNEGLSYDMPWELLLTGIGATLIVIVAISFRRWWKSRHLDPSAAALFSAIARKAGLGWRDRYLLWRISKTFNLPTPITLMLSRGALRHYTNLYLSNRAGNPRTSQRLAQIESILFS